MVQSSEEPQLIQVDWGRLKNGTLDILVHWNPLQKTRDDGLVYWEYDECRMNWILPHYMSSKQEIQEYLDSNYNQGENILSWAQASKLKLDALD